MPNNRSKRRSRTEDGLVGGRISQDMELPTLTTAQYLEAVEEGENEGVLHAHSCECDDCVIPYDAPFAVWI